MSFVTVVRTVACAMFLCATTSAQQRIEVKIDPRVELITVAEALSGAFPESISREDTAYRRDVDAWFGAFKNHPAIQRLAGLHAKGYGYDAPVGTLICLSAPPGLALEAKLEDCNADRAGGNASLLAWLGQLRDFARQSDFVTFFRNHAGWYSTVEDSVRRQITRDYAADLESYYGIHQASYHLVPAPLMASSNFGPRRRRGDGAFDVYEVISSHGTAGGLPQFGPEQNLRGLAWHEFGHSFVNPEIDRLSAAVERSSALMKPIEQVMRSQAYGIWKIAVYEHLVRAVEVRLAFRELGDQAGRAALKYEKASGFAYVELLADKLKEYEQQRDRYPTFHDFVPRLVEMLEQLASRPLSPDLFVIPPTPSGMARQPGPTVLIVPTAETDAAAQEQLVADVKRMQARFFADSELITDEQALARDLSACRIYAYGTLAGNKWLARYRDFIPAASLLDHAAGAGPLRLITAISNPQNPQRTAVVYTATSAAAVRGINGVFHGPESFVLAKGETVLKTGDYVRRDGRWVLP